MGKPKAPGTIHLQRITYAPQFGKLAETLVTLKYFMTVFDPELMPLNLQGLLNVSIQHLLRLTVSTL